MMKNKLIIFGTISTIAIPVFTVVACANSTQKSSIKIKVNYYWVSSSSGNDVKNISNVEKYFVLKKDEISEYSIQDNKLKINKSNGDDLVLISPKEDQTPGDYFTLPLHGSVNFITDSIFNEIKEFLKEIK